MKHPEQSPLPRLTQFAGRLLVTGHLLILAFICFFAILLQGEGRAEALLYIEPYMASVGASAAVLWGVSLGIDWMERRYGRK